MCGGIYNIAYTPEIIKPLPIAELLHKSDCEQQMLLIFINFPKCVHWYGNFQFCKSCTFFEQRLHKKQQMLNLQNSKALYNKLQDLYIVCIGLVNVQLL